MTTRLYDAACFDLDGTLIDTEPLHLDAERRALQTLGVEQLAGDHPKTFGMGILPGMALLSEVYGLGGQQKVLDVYLPLWDRLLETELELMPGAPTFSRCFAMPQSQWRS